MILDTGPIHTIWQNTGRNIVYDAYPARDIGLTPLEGRDDSGPAYVFSANCG